jgi:hypothetical protein
MMTEHDNRIVCLAFETDEEALRRALYPVAGIGGQQIKQ